MSVRRPTGTVFVAAAKLRRVAAGKLEARGVPRADAATTMNRMMNARRDGQPLPEGVALDRRARPTTDAEEVAVLVPGDPEYRVEGVRAVKGIPIEPGLQKELLDTPCKTPS